MTSTVLLATGFLQGQEDSTEIEPAPLIQPDRSDESGAPIEQIAPLPVAEGPPHDTERNPADNAVAAIPRKFRYSGRLTVRAVYDDNIELSEINKVDDIYFAIEPEITLGFGDIVARQENFIRLDYAPSIFLFADHSDQNAVQHLIRLEALHRFSRLTVSLSQDIQLLAGANLNTITNAIGGGNPARLDVSSRTPLNLYTTNLSATYELTGKTFLSGGAQYSVSDYSELIGSKVISGNLFINYNYSPKLVIGLGGSIGYDWVDSPGVDQTFEQLNVRVTYQATGKISLSASAGVEFRQFQDESRGGYTSPVYELAATYQPFDGTMLSLKGSRRILNSAVFQDQDYANTNITVSARQRLFQRFYLGLTAGYENSEYFSTIGGVAASRTDNFFFIEPTIEMTITRFWTVGIYYLYREIDSSFNDFSFANNQFGVRSTLIF